jgi:hypothetical protein
MRDVIEFVAKVVRTLRVRIAFGSRRTRSVRTTFDNLRLFVALGPGGVLGVLRN